MNKYYVDYPRDFANEYTVYVVRTTDTGRLKSRFPDAERISRREAIRLGWTRPRKAKKDGEQWYGGFASNNYADSVGEAIDVAISATIEEIYDLQR